MALATPTHAADKVVVAQEPLPFVSGELTALIRVDCDRVRGVATPKGHQQRIKDQSRVDAASHGPAHHLA